MYRQFEFEGDIHTSLDCVPMAVRRKLDLARLKISLTGWQALSRAERLALCHLPVNGPGDVAVYVEVLRDFSRGAGVELKPLPPPDEQWNAATLPPEIAERLERASIAFAPRQWTTLDVDARYALSKLADAKREPAKLIAAALEVGLASGAGSALPPEQPCGQPPRQL